MKKSLLATVLFIGVNAQAQNIPLENEWNVERPQMPITVESAYPAVCADGVTVPTCSPVNDLLCWNWCEMETRSVGDIRHWKGQLWKDHWTSCKADLKQWVTYAEQLQGQVIQLQQQMSKCKKWGK